MLAKIIKEEKFPYGTTHVLIVDRFLGQEGCTSHEMAMKWDIEV